jgi:hypothetical protein
MEYVGQDRGYAKQIRDHYNEVDYHQPSDEFQPTWDMSGAIEDMRLLAELGWAIANSSEVPAYNPGEQFARPREGRP